MTNRSPITNTQLLTPLQRRQLRQWIEVSGEQKVREELGISKLPLARLLSGLPVQRTTLTVARAGIQRFIAEAP